MAFSNETLHFLFENRLQDNKEWFENHRNDYEQVVLTPLKELVVALEPVIRGIDPLLICEPKINRSISRIYRDVRFSKDKSRYRDVMWVVFSRDKKLYHGSPALFFELSPRGFDYGLGYYCADKASMESMRQLILQKHPTFQKALQAYEKQDIFSLVGDCYKKSKAPDAPEKIKAWTDRKTVSLLHESTDLDFLFSQDLANVLGKQLQTLKPIYDFFQAAESRKE